MCVWGGGGGGGVAKMSKDVGMVIRKSIAV